MKLTVVLIKIVEKNEMLCSVLMDWYQIVPLLYKINIKRPEYIVLINLQFI